MNFTFMRQKTPFIYVNRNIHIPCRGLFFVLLIIGPFCSAAQDTGNNQDSIPKKRSNNILRLALGAVTRNPADSAKESNVLNTKSELQFMPYKGKTIRHVFIQIYGFERNFADTSRAIDYYGTRLLNRLHRDTREWVIRNNVYINAGTPVDPYKMADNERHLRSVEFIQDARILVKPIPGNPQEVDVYIITKDFFSLTGEINDISTSKFKGRVADANVAGMGQKAQAVILWDKGRSPSFGYELLYSKNNIAGTFVNATAVYSKIRPDLAYAQDAEHAWYINLERPLVSQYSSHVAGGLTIAHHQSTDGYNKPDSLYYNYRYNLFDIWAGYNLDRKLSGKNNAYPNHFFLSGRVVNYHFTERPKPVTTPYNFRYDDKRAFLAQLTFFRQNFYKANYIFGFGTTEDIPYGYNIAFTTGLYKQNDLQRPYVGIDANRYVASDRGFFLQYFLRSGAFLEKKQLQDAGILAGASVFSPLFNYRNIKIRQYVRLSYTKEFNRVGLDPLRINNSFGLRYFSSDSAMGDQRISFHSETFFFLSYKLFGFKFAPFAFTDVAALTPDKEKFSKTDFFYGIGGGLRTRNENLVFNTIELRFAYFPRKINEEAFKISLSSNIRFRYNTNYVKAPDIIQLNNDDANNIY